MLSKPYQTKFHIKANQILLKKAFIWILIRYYWINYSYYCKLYLIKQSFIAILTRFYKIKLLYQCQIGININQPSLGRIFIISLTRFY